MILICPTAFKGTLTATQAAEAMARGARAAVGDEEVRTLPLSDGGNGLIECMDAGSASAESRIDTSTVAGPLGKPTTARFLVQPRRVVVETAEACGLHLVPEGRRDPLRTSTRGVGELMRAAAVAARPEASRDPLELVIGLGGSATVDAGAGMAAALGWRLLDSGGDPIPDGGAGLLRLHTIEPPISTSDPGAAAGPALRGGDPRSGSHLPIPVVLADVNNPLLGPTGAASVYGPQKGATPEDVQVLEEALERWAEVVRRDLGRDVAHLPGAGAAGGLGAAFAAFLGAPPRPGADWLLDHVHFDEAISRARLVITGEGAWDAQSSMGKITGRVVERAGPAGRPVAVVSAAPPEPGHRAPSNATLVSGSGGKLGEAELSDLVAGLLRDLPHPPG